MSQKSLAQWLGNLLSATALALPYVASLEISIEFQFWCLGGWCHTNNTSLLGHQMAKTYLWLRGKFQMKKPEEPRTKAYSQFPCSACSLFSPSPLFPCEVSSKNHAWSYLPPDSFGLGSSSVNIVVVVHCYCGRKASLHHSHSLVRIRQSTTPFHPCKCGKIKINIEFPQV